MDKFIAAYEGKAADDLFICRTNGVAYQIDRSFVIDYGGEYYDKCLSYEDQEIALKINDGRINLVSDHFGSGRVLDIGIGSGEFVKKRPNTFGFDVNPVAVEWLWAKNLYGTPDQFSVFSFWDVLEHVETPDEYLRHVPIHGKLFASLPIFDDLSDIPYSRHYRPGEHLYYWTDVGFQSWMAAHGFKCLEKRDFETQAGRDSILSYAFKRIIRTC